MSVEGGNDNGLDSLRLVAHPLRLRLLSLLTGRAMSAAEAARELGEGQANVSYHIRRLAKGGLLELVGEESIRGGVAKRYIHNSDSGEAITISDRATHRQLVEVMARQMTTRAGTYREGTTFAFTDAHVAIPRDQWVRLEEAARDVGKLVHELAELPTGSDTVTVSLTIVAFETE